VRNDSLCSAAAAFILSLFACGLAFAQAPAPVSAGQQAMQEQGQGQAQPAVSDAPGGSMKGPQGKGGHKSMRDLLDPNAHDLPPMPPPPPGEEPSYGMMKKLLEQSLSDEDKANLKKMAFENPDEFREEMHKRFQSIHQKRLEDNKKLAELLKACRDASTPEAKQQALDKLRALVKEQFVQKMELNKKRLEETEKNLQEASKRLDEFKRKFEERSSRADQIIDERVKDLLKDPNLDW